MSPEELHPLYAELVMRGDLDGLVDLYEDGAVFKGGQTIRDQLGAWLARRPTFVTHTRAVVTSGDIALLASDWRITTTADDGEHVVSSGTSVEVARRQGDGTWRYVIDEPTFLEHRARDRAIADPA